MSDCPKELHYTQSHVWIHDETKGKKRCARIGVTEELANRLGHLLGVDMPMVGDELEMDSPCVHFHRTKNSIYDLPAPLTGRVTAINKDVLDDPALIALGPYRNWLYCMEYDEDEEFDMLLSAQQYNTYLDSL